MGDTLSGGAGMDALTGYGGADSIDGGIGIDTWKEDFSSLGSAVSITLTTTAGANTSATISMGKQPIPIVKNIEALVLQTGSGADFISVGTLAQDDDIRTNSGNDTINVGTGGSDYVDGGSGVDVGLFNWSASTTNITVNPTYDDYSGGVGRYVNFNNIERFNLTGGSGNDYLAGEVYSDTLLGGSGRDTLYGDRGADSINGGDGVDVWEADYHSSTAAIKITLTTELDANEIWGGITGASIKNIERLNLATGSGNDVISAGTLAYDDDISSNEGNDTINVGSGGADAVDGGSGNDLGIFNWSMSTTDISVNPTYDDYSDSEGRYVDFDNVERFNIIGGSGSDYLAGDAWNDTLTGGKGDDTLDGGSLRTDVESFNADVIDGGEGIDYWLADFSQSPHPLNILLSGALNANAVLGGIANSLVKNIEHMEFIAGSGDDLISSGTFAYDDSIEGGDGDDEINVGAGGSDYADGGAGIDVGRFDWSTSTSSITTDDTYDEYSDLQGRYVNFDSIEIFDLTGGAGNDYFACDEFSDTLVGGTGDDERDAYGGDDVLTGGIGADMFDIRGDSGNDIITDFTVSQDFVYLIDNPFSTIGFDVIRQNMSQEGNDTVLTLTNVDSIRFVGVDINTFAADHFLWG